MCVCVCVYIYIYRERERERENERAHCVLHVEPVTPFFRVVILVIFHLKQAVMF